MSRGPGRIERAIRGLFDAHPDEAFTTDDLCLACYGPPITRSHSVAVLRAARNVVATDPDWRCLPLPMRQNCAVFCNMTSVPSVIMRTKLLSPYGPARDAVRAILDAPPGSWHAEVREKARQRVADHVALRDADLAERERIKARRQAELAQITSNIRSIRDGGQSVVEAPPLTERQHLSILAEKARALITENDPDVIRAGLAEIAAALEGDDRDRADIADVGGRPRSPSGG